MKLDNDTRLERLLTEVGSERMRQEAMKAAGRFKLTCADEMTNDERFVVLGEEIGEVAREVLTQPDRRIAFDTEGSLAGLRKELIQVAAVAVAWVEGLDRPATAQTTDGWGSTEGTEQRAARSCRASG